MAKTAEILEIPATITARGQTTVPAAIRKMLALEFLARDMASEPARIRPVTKSLLSRGKALVKGVEADLDAALPDDEA